MDGRQGRRRASSRSEWRRAMRTTRSRRRDSWARQQWNKKRGVGVCARVGLRRLASSFVVVLVGCRRQLVALVLLLHHLHSTSLLVVSCQRQQRPLVCCLPVLPSSCKAAHFSDLPSVLILSALGLAQLFSSRRLVFLPCFLPLFRSLPPRSSPSQPRQPSTRCPR